MRNAAARLALAVVAEISLSANLASFGARTTTRPPAETAACGEPRPPAAPTAAGRRGALRFDSARARAGLRGYHNAIPWSADTYKLHTPPV